MGSKNSVAGYQVVIVGAGPAGIGMAAALQDFGISDYVVLEKDEVGSSFLRWNEDTRLLTPSFQSTQFGLLDLNAVALNTSPAYSSGKEHLSGKEYAQYLQRVVKALHLKIKPDTTVKDVQKKGDTFFIETTKGNYHSRFLVWATGEFQFPDLTPFPGAEHCILLAHVKSYKELEGEEYSIIGGYESGVDAAIHLSRLGKSVNLIDKQEVLAADSQDPSITLSFYTRQRLDELPPAEDRIRLFDKHEVSAVTQQDGIYYIHTNKGYLLSEVPPLLATGFTGGEQQISHLFHSVEGNMELNQWDESTKTPGLFLAGPHVRHENVIFCFIYKFRQRFGIIAARIARAYGIDTQQAELNYRNDNMFLDDLSCCETDCTC